MSHGEDHGASSAIPWMAQLDLDRPCGVVSSGETCWLLDDFPAWNSVIHALGMDLEETAPGTLRLRLFPNAQLKNDLVTVARGASVVASSLLCHHVCILEVYLECAISTSHPAAQPSFPIFMRGQSSSQTFRSLRSLRITESRSLVYVYCEVNASAHLDLRDVDAVVGLETLYIHIGHFSERLAAEIDSLLKRNRNTLKNVTILEAGPGNNKLSRVEDLAACKFLALRSSHFTRKPDVEGMLSLLRGSVALKEAAVEPVFPQQLLLIAKSLETNPCLTKLTLQVKSHHSIEELFGALQVNKHLKELFLYSFVRVSLTTRCTRVVASALGSDNCLQTLSMKGMYFPSGEMDQLSKALSKNCTLQLLGMCHSDFRVSEVSVLCKALQVNKSLKTLKLSQIVGSYEERASLARQLLRYACYERVQLFDRHTEPYLRVLSPVLASSEAGISDLRLSDISQLSHETVSVLFNALATSKKIKRLTVVLCEFDRGVALLCETLKNNRSMQSLRIQICNGDAAKEILRALAVNTSITELNLRLWVEDAAEETCAALSDMLSRNDTITSIYVSFIDDYPERYLEAYAQGLSSNRLILSMGYSVPHNTYIPPSLWVPVRRNRAGLNRAMDFILEHREDRHCAECFELFFGRSCLITNLIEIAGMSDFQARVGVVAAENRRREKYLVLTGVVRRSVVCWPADVTQIDSLNWDCWCAITRYLKVTDVCFSR